VRQKGFAPILIILLITIVAVGGYLVYNRLGYSLSKKVYTNYSNNRTKAVSSTAAKIDETANWKTYTNRDFTIKYPQDAKLENSTSIFDFLNFEYVSLFIINHLPDVVDEDFYQIQFAVIKDAQPTTPEEIVAKYVDTNAKERKERIMASLTKYKNGNINGLFFRDPGTHPNEDYVFVIAVKDNIIFNFKIRGNNSGLNNDKLLIANKILSTFNPNQTILSDESLDQLIRFTLPEGWRLEKQSKGIARQASGALVIKSSDYDDKNPPTFMHENRPGSRLVIYKNYGGSIYTREDKYKQIYDEIHDPNPAGATDHDLTKLTIGGYPAISYLYTFEGYEHTYNIWQDDNIWTILTTAPPDQSQLDKFLSSITFNKEN